MSGNGVGDRKAWRGTRDTATIPPSLVHSQLDRILASGTFRRSTRLGRFLRFLVERTLSGQEGSIKEHVLGAEVFDRKPPFDPQSDPIVRVEVRRLRTKLERYYQTEGQEDPVLINLPVRTYIPRFLRRLRRNAGLNRISASLRWISGWKAMVLSAIALVLFGPYLFRVAGFPGWRPPTQEVIAGRAAERSLIVLPFADLNGDKDLESFADGLTEETIAALAKVEDLHVVSRTSSFHFKGQSEDVRKIGAQFNVDLVLEGSVRVSGENLRVTGELVKVADGFQLWSSTYERPINELPLPEDIARSIAETVQERLAETCHREGAQYPTSVEAHDLYLKGLYRIRHGDEEGFVDGIECFEQAIRIAPNFALPYAGLADSYSMLGLEGLLAPGEAMPKAEAAASKALELDTTLGHAHAALGVIKASYRWDWAGAKQEFQRALQLDPGDAEIKEAYVISYLLPWGRLDEATSEIQRARSLDSDSAQVSSAAGLTLYFKRQYDDAIAQYRNTLELQPHYHSAHLALASSLMQKSMFDDAIKALRKGAGGWQGDLQESLLGYAYARTGNKPLALDLIDELKQAAKWRPVSPTCIAEVYAGLRDYDRTIEWLEKGYQQHSPAMIYIKVNPLFDGLRSDPRFVSLLKRVRLE